LYASPTLSLANTKTDDCIIIIIIMWLVQSWTLPFLRACSM